MQVLQSIETSNSQIITKIYGGVEKSWNYELPQQEVKALTISYIQIIKAEAELHNSKACFLLGRCYDRGYAFPKSQRLSRQWHQKAKSLGQPHSYYNLYLSQKSKQKKRVLLQEGVQKGQFRCIYQRAEQCLKQQITAIQQSELSYCIELMERLNAHKYVQAHYLGWLLYSKKNSKFYNRTKALQNLKLYALKSEPETKWPFFYGCQLEKQENFEEAIEVLEQGIQDHKEDTQKKGKIYNMIGVCYHRQQKNEQAKKWFKMGMGKNYLRSFNQLAIIYFKEQKFQLAIEVLFKAIKLANNKKNDIAVIYENLGKCFQRIHDNQQAFHFYYQSAALIHWISYAECGWMLHQGIAVKQDQLKGKCMLIEAQKQGEEIAQGYLQQINA